MSTKGYQDQVPGKLGLRQFGRGIQTLWQSLDQGDPYAEWQLLKIHTALEELKADMHAQETILRKQVRSLKGLQIRPFRNTKPFTAFFSSADFLLLRAAGLIAQMDYLIRETLTLKQIGIVPLGQAHMQDFWKAIQKIYTLSGAWKPLDITREDILENNDKAQQAEKVFGALPEEILLQTLTLPFLNLIE